MGNLCQKDQNQIASNRSSICYEPRKGICIKETHIDKYFIDRKSSLLIPSVSRLIIKEELDQETGTPRVDESPLKGSNLTSCTSNWNIRESQFGNNTIQLLNMNCQRYLHSHRIRNQNSRLNEVIICKSCHNDYDNWQFENINEKLVKIYHPLTKYYLKAIQRSNNGYIEIGAGENGDLWNIEKNDDSIKIIHQDSGLYLHVCDNNQESDSQIKVSLININCVKPEELNVNWKTIDIQ